MFLISVIMPCYNAGEYLEKSVQSLIKQSWRNWELIIVNDGSTDTSEAIASSLASRDKRIRTISKPNGGYVSARLAGYQIANAASKYLLFYDADDLLHPDMLADLSAEMENNEDVGAAYCDHRVMDENDRIEDAGIDMPRFVPTRFWSRKLPDDAVETPFISIFCWTKMIEPMTLIRRTAYEQTPGWDISFGKGIGNIGEGVYLFAEIALHWKVHFVNKPLYFYRRHSTQMSAIPSNKMQVQVNKVIDKWKERIKLEKNLVGKIHPAIIFLKYRLAAKKRIGSLPHQIRYKPLKAIRTGFFMIVEYTASLPLIFSYRKLVKNN